MSRITKSKTKRQPSIYKQKLENGVKQLNSVSSPAAASSSSTFCLLCEKSNANVNCNGSCSQSFHSECVSVDNGSNTFLCEDCQTGEHVCFACKGKGNDVTKCSIDSCGKFYHDECLKKLPTLKNEKNVCPLHLCISCYNRDTKNQQFMKGSLTRCFRCPTAIHAKDECMIPGCLILSEDLMVCPGHFSPEEERKYPAIKHFSLCSKCNDGGDLIFCTVCPSAVHRECLKKPNLHQVYVCERCIHRKQLHFNDVVWAKICEFRWWPAKILNPKDIPDEVQNMNHYDGEFPVQFFATEEYFWVQKERVLPFSYDENSFDGDNKRKNFKKSTFDKDFSNAIDMALMAVKENNKKLPVLSSNCKKPAPYVSIKTNKPIGNVQIYLDDSKSFTHCGCSPKDEDPCGYETLCLNRSMYSECHPDVCEAGERCQNQKFQKRQYAAAVPFFTKGRDWGLKATKDIKKGHFVMEYVGDLIDEEECEKRIKQKQKIGDTNFYYLKLDAERIIDAGPKGNLSRFMNHSCEPNCETQKWMVNGDLRVGIFAIQDILSGSEITFDYQMDFSYFEKLPCNCGAASCSKLIGKKPQKNNTAKAVQPLESHTPTKPSLNEVLPKENDKCIKCNETGKLVTCVRKACFKVYHMKCLKFKKESPSGIVCEWHYCQTCNKLAKYKCMVCTTSFCQIHVGASIAPSDKYLCPSHSKTS